MRRALGRLGSLATALVVALWMATCAAAPELLWQGLKLFMSHLGWLTLAIAVLMAMIFLCFVEPILRRLRALVLHAPDEEPAHRPGSILLWSGLGLLFGLVSVCLHEAVAEFIGGHSSDGFGPDDAIELAISFAAIPFVVTIAWQATRRPWTAIPTAIVAIASPLLAGWLFSWTPETVLTTTVPGLAILLLGYRDLRAHPDASLKRYATIIAAVAGGWLVVALVIDGLLFAIAGGSARLYDWTEFFVDLRFYMGWTLGPLLAPASFAWTGRRGGYQQV